MRAPLFGLIALLISPVALAAYLWTGSFTPWGWLWAACTLLGLLLVGKQLKDVFGSPVPPQGKTGVPVCLGDSLTQGTVSDRWVSRLPMAIENHGVNGDLAYNVRQRLQVALSSSPPWVTLWCGTNDARGIVSEDAANMYIQQKSLPQAPTEDFFRSNYQQILEALEGTPTVVLTLPPLGEQPDSPENQVVERLNHFIRAQADARGLPCVDVYALFSERLSSGAPAYSNQGSLVRMMTTGMRYAFFETDLDRMSEQGGMVYSHDFVHLNHRAGAMVAEAVQEALTQLRPSAQAQ